MCNCHFTNQKLLTEEHAAQGWAQGSGQEMHVLQELCIKTQVRNKHGAAGFVIRLLQELSGWLTQVGAGTDGQGRVCSVSNWKTCCTKQPCAVELY